MIGTISGFAKQSFDIERPCEHGELAVGRARPFFAWSITIEFDAVFVGIT